MRYDGHRQLWEVVPYDLEGLDVVLIWFTIPFREDGEHRFLVKNCAHISLVGA